MPENPIDTSPEAIQRRLEQEKADAASIRATVSKIGYNPKKDPHVQGRQLKTYAQASKEATQPQRDENLHQYIDTVRKNTSGNP